MRVVMWFARVRKSSSRQSPGGVVKYGLQAIAEFGLQLQFLCGVVRASSPPSGLVVVMMSHQFPEHQLHPLDGSAEVAFLTFVPSLRQMPS